MILRQWLAAAGACVVLAASTPAFAQRWPSRTVKVVVPYGVGGVTDTMARVTADRLGKALNQTFVIENKLGAGGAIGVDYALNSPQDGYTILFVCSTLFTVLPLAQKVTYEPLKDLVPVSIVGTNGMVLVVDKSAPYSTLREFIDYAAGKEGLDMVLKTRLSQALQPIARDPEITKLFANLGIDAVGTTADEAVESIRKDM